MRGKQRLMVQYKILHLTVTVTLSFVGMRDTVETRQLHYKVQKHVLACNLLTKAVSCWMTI